MTSIAPRMPLRALFLASLLGGALMTGCGGGGGGAPAVEPPSSAPAPVPAPTPTPAPAPTVTAVTPTSITPPARLTVTGTNLDRVSQARLGSTVLAIAAQSATSLVLDVPAGASSNFLTLVDSSGTARQSAQQISVIGAMAVATFSPATVAPGATLTISGTALDRAGRIEFAGGVSAAIATRTGTTALTVTVPNGAQTGPVVAVTASGERAASAAAVTVVARIEVTNAGAVNVAPGGTVTLTGSGFGEVSGVTVGGVAAAIGARSATQLSFTVPAGVTCGAIVLQSASQPAVAGGSVASAACVLRVESIEFAQVLSQPSTDPRQRLVPQRETWVRAFVVADSAGVAAPTVRLTAFHGATAAGSVAMTGPATLPVLAAGSALPASLRNSGAQSFNARLDDSWVRAGLRVEVTVDPDQRSGAPVVATSTPAVGTGTRIDLVLVPVVSGSNTPTVASNAAALALDELTRRLPVARDNISVTVRAPYTLTSVTDGVDASGEWSSALSELERLRDQEAPNRHYYGLVRPMVSAGTAGIGYVNRVGSSSPALASLGWDTSRGSWLRTLIHELGHNYSREHAPCGGVSSSDANYPYSGGALGPTPLFDVLADAVVSPVNLSDVMGYCGGLWFSDYNLREVQRFLEARPQVAPLVTAQAVSGPTGKAAATEVIVVSGAIGLDGVRLAPVQALPGTAELAEQGEYAVRLRTVDGGVFELPFDAVTVDHAMPPERHFRVRIPNPGPLQSLEVLRGGSVIARRAADQPTAEIARAMAAAAPAQVVSVGDALQVRWDASRFGWASVTHVGVDGRTVLMLDARGGELTLPAAAVPAGGRLEVTLSDGLNARLVSLPR